MATVALSIAPELNRGHSPVQDRRSSWLQEDTRCRLKAIAQAWVSLCTPVVESGACATTNRDMRFTVLSTSTTVHTRPAKAKDLNTKLLCNLERTNSKPELCAEQEREDVPLMEFHDTASLARARVDQPLSQDMHTSQEIATAEEGPLVLLEVIHVDFQSQDGFLKTAGKKAKKAAAAAARAKWADEDDESSQKNNDEGNGDDGNRSADDSGHAGGGDDAGNGDKKDEEDDRKEPEEAKAEDEWDFAPVKKTKKGKKGKQAEPVFQSIEDKTDMLSNEIAEKPATGIGTYDTNWTTGTTCKWDFSALNTEPDTSAGKAPVEAESEDEWANAWSTTKKKKGKKGAVSPLPESIPSPAKEEVSTPADDLWSFGNTKKKDKKKKKNCSWEPDPEPEPELIPELNLDETKADTPPEDDWFVPVSKKDKKKKKGAGIVAVPDASSDLVAIEDATNIENDSWDAWGSTRTKKKDGKADKLLETVEVAKEEPAVTNPIEDDFGWGTWGKKDKKKKGKSPSPEPVGAPDIVTEQTKEESPVEDWSFGTKKDKKIKAKTSIASEIVNPLPATTEQQTDYGWGSWDTKDSKKKKKDKDIVEEPHPAIPDPPPMDLTEAEPDDWGFGTSSKSRKEKKKKEEAEIKKKAAEEKEKAEAERIEAEEKAKQDEQAEADRKKTTSPALKLSKKEQLKADKLKAKAEKEASDLRAKEEQEATELKLKEEEEAAARAAIIALEAEEKSRADAEAKEAAKVAKAFAKLPKKEQERIKKKEKADKEAAEQEELLVAAAKELEEQGKDDADLLDLLDDCRSKSSKKTAKLSKTESRLSDKSTRDSLELDRKSTKSPSSNAASDRLAAKVPTVSGLAAGAFGFWEANKKSSADYVSASNSSKVATSPSTARKAVGNKISERLKAFEPGKEDEAPTHDTPINITKPSSPTPSNKSKSSSKSKDSDIRKLSSRSQKSTSVTDIPGSFPIEDIAPDMPSANKKSSKKSSNKDKDELKKDDLPPPTPPPAPDAPPLLTTDKSSKDKKDRARIERNGSSWGTWGTTAKAEEVKLSKNDHKRTASPDKKSSKIETDDKKAKTSKPKTSDDKAASSSSDKGEKKHKSPSSKPPISRSASTREHRPSTGRRSSSNRHSFQDVGGLLSPEPEVTGKAAKILGIKTPGLSRSKSERHSRRSGGPTRDGDVEEKISRPPVSGARRSYYKNETDTDTDVPLKRSHSQRGSFSGMFGSLLSSKARDDKRKSSISQHDDESRRLRHERRKLQRSREVSPDNAEAVFMTGGASTEDQEARRAARRAKKAEREAAEKAAHEAQLAKENERRERHKKREEADEALRQEQRAARREERKNRKLAEEADQVAADERAERHRVKRAERQASASKDMQGQDGKSRPSKSDRKHSSRTASTPMTGCHDAAQPVDDYFDSRNGTDKASPAEQSRGKENKTRKSKRPGWPHSGTDSWVKDHSESPAPPPEIQKTSSVKVDELDGADEEERRKLRKTRKAERASRYEDEDERRRRRDARHAERGDIPVRSPARESKGSWWKTIAGV